MARRDQNQKPDRPEDEKVKTQPRPRRYDEDDEFYEAIPAASTRQYVATERRADVGTTGVLMVLSGIWLIIAPFVLGYQSTTPKWNDIALGVIVGAVALLGMMTAPRIASWINLLAGIWLIIAPFVLGYSGTQAVTAAWNDVILGIIVGLLGLWGMSAATAMDDDVV